MFRPPRTRHPTSRNDPVSMASLNTVQHEPSRFLRHTDRPMDFVGGNPILAVGQHPDRGEPLIQAERAVLENRPALRRELLADMRALAFPQAAGLDEPDISASTLWAVHAIRPAKLNHRRKRHIRVREVLDGFHEGLGFGAHDGKSTEDRLLRQVYYYLCNLSIGGFWERASRDRARSVSALSQNPPKSMVPRASALCGDPGATPLGGFQGGALTLC